MKRILLFCALFSLLNVVFVQAAQKEPFLYINESELVKVSDTIKKIRNDLPDTATNPISIMCDSIAYSLRYPINSALLSASVLSFQASTTKGKGSDEARFAVFIVTKQNIVHVKENIRDIEILRRAFTKYPVPEMILRLEACARDLLKILEDYNTALDVK